MKVGTDGVLLGAWVNTGSAKTILDIGTGTGLIALMMAQRSSAFVTGIEIENKAALEASENALSSPWKDRIRMINTSLQEYFKNQTVTYDLIISNPPFFTNSQKSKCEMLAMAKHNHLLPPGDLIECSAKLLNKHGRLAIILPYDAVKTVKELAVKENLYPLRETEVKPNPHKKTHRFLLEFGRSISQPVETDVIHIHNADGNSFTEQYKSLTRQFYLNF